MRQSVIVATTAFAAVIIAILGATVITANAPKTATAAPASPPISVMQMMRDAKNLPDQQFDAY
jgi:hypothetical protein